MSLFFCHTILPARQPWHFPESVLLEDLFDGLPLQSRAIDIRQMLLKLSLLGAEQQDTGHRFLDLKKMFFYFPLKMRNGKSKIDY